VDRNALIVQMVIALGLGGVLKAGIDAWISRRRTKAEVRSTEAVAVEVVARAAVSLVEPFQEQLTILRAELTATHTELQATRAELARTRAQLGEAQAEIGRLRTRMGPPERQPGVKEN
jgi:chromosome segregation ATPase